jgi:hypothetical protein
MYKNEIKKDVEELTKGIKNIDNELTRIKIAIHNLDKFGYNMEEEYKQMNDLGIEMYKMKMLVEKRIKECK